MNKIFLESTEKLKTKVLIFSGVSLFVGLTKSLPTEVSLKGLNLEGKECIVGWFLFIITFYLTIHFVVLVGFDLIKFFKDSIISKKSKNLRGDTIGLTYEEIGEEYDRQNEYLENNNFDEHAGTLGAEAEDIHRKIQKLKDDFDITYVSIYNKIDIVFNGIVPFALSIIGLWYLYCFLKV